MNFKEIIHCRTLLSTTTSLFSPPREIVFPRCSGKQGWFIYLHPLQLLPRSLHRIKYNLLKQNLRRYQIFWGLNNCKYSLPLQNSVPSIFSSVAGLESIQAMRQTHNQTDIVIDRAPTEIAVGKTENWACQEYQRVVCSSSWSQASREQRGFCDLLLVTLRRSSKLSHAIFFSLRLFSTVNSQSPPPSLDCTRGPRDSAANVTSDDQRIESVLWIWSKVEKFYLIGAVFFFLIFSPFSISYI